MLTKQAEDVEDGEDEEEASGDELDWRSANHVVEPAEVTAEDYPYANSVNNVANNVANNNNEQTNAFQVNEADTGPDLSITDRMPQQQQQSDDVSAQPPTVLPRTVSPGFSEASGGVINGAWAGEAPSSSGLGVAGGMDGGDGVGVLSGGEGEQEAPPFSEEFEEVELQVRVFFGVFVVAVSCEVVEVLVSCRAADGGKVVILSFMLVVVVVVILFLFVLLLLFLLLVSLLLLFIVVVIITVILFLGTNSGIVPPHDHDHIKVTGNFNLE